MWWAAEGRQINISICLIERCEIDCVWCNWWAAEGRPFRAPRGTDRDQMNHGKTCCMWWAAEGRPINNTISDTLVRLSLLCALLSVGGQGPLRLPPTIHACVGFSTCQYFRISYLKHGGPALAGLNSSIYIYTLVLWPSLPATGGPRAAGGGRRDRMVPELWSPPPNTPSNF